MNKIKTFENSKSGHADNASMSNMLASYAIWREVAEKAGPELAMKACKSFNFAGYARMSSIPSPAQAWVLFAMTNGVWGNHPMHANVPASLDLIRNKSVDATTRFGYAEVMLKHPDKGLHAWIADVVNKESGFTADQLITLGLRQPEVKVTPPVASNVVNVNDLAAEVLARTMGISLTEAHAMIANANAPKVETFVPDDFVLESHGVAATQADSVVKPKISPNRKSGHNPK